MTESAEIDYHGEVRFEDEQWIRAGHFATRPTLADLRRAAWDVISSRRRGSPLPIEVRLVVTTIESGSPFPFQDGSLKENGYDEVAVTDPLAEGAP